jgi:hypothetical protein
MAQQIFITVVVVLATAVIAVIATSYFLKSEWKRAGREAARERSREAAQARIDAEADLRESREGTTVP